MYNCCLCDYCICLCRAFDPLNIVLQSLKQCKDDGCDDKETALTIKYKFEKKILASANAQAQEFIIEDHQNYKNINKNIESFTNKEIYKIYIPYFKNIEKYTLTDYERECVFLETALDIVKAKRDLLANENYINDVTKCLVFTQNVLNLVPTSDATST